MDAAMNIIKVSETTQHARESGEIIASINDLLIEILLRLPMKSLWRFKRVSKNWQSLITNPKFRHWRTPNPNPAVGLFLPHKNYRVNNLYEYVPLSPKNPTVSPCRETSFTKEYNGISILHSCNGLLLCCGYPGVPKYFALSTDYHVYNPTINQFTTLPKQDMNPLGPMTRVSVMSLAFDPAKSHHYKVVCVLLPSVGHLVQIDIYSSETDEWTAIGHPFAASADFEKGVYWNDAMHWIRDRYDGDSLYFNVHNHTHQKMPNPPVDWQRYSMMHHYFGESCGHLHYIENGGWQIVFNVYEMKRDYSEWFVKYHVDLFSASNPGMIPKFATVCVVRLEEEDDSFIVSSRAGKVIRYNLVRKTFETLHEFKSKDEYTTNGFQYIESLSSV